ncbi:MAG: WecB/TagA/CpsF family glycosyltransferase [Gammaproteobacteria bacterium]|nr:WecB/TagA/CpsF family glycosyltransferase [Gammaproteobacteria bacterium]MBU1483039.1 WecB/TagA/CpsF family glycosyltransferase [Gammaproteobacteria bacterium]
MAFVSAESNNAIFAAAFLEVKRQPGNVKGAMTIHSDFNREAHCLLGLPFDAVDMQSVLHRIRKASSEKSPCFLSTPNLNFLIAAQSDAAFRDSVVNSDLSIADGMPIVWMAKLLGIPIRERLAGSDVFELLRTASPPRLSVYFFGGLEGVAELACNRLNAESSGLRCAGFKYPGFASVPEMSSDANIEEINSSGADFLVVSLGAKKGQSWIEHNRSRISAPVISHLGAVVNFVAGGLDRAPVWIRRSGLEWLWRIKEEPGLWRRYTVDGWMFAKLLLARVVPYAWYMLWHKPTDRELDSAAVERFDEDSRIIIRLQGAWVQKNLGPLRECFAGSVRAGKDVLIDLERVTYVDSAFMGLLMLLYGDRKRQARHLSVVKAKKDVLKLFRYGCAEYLLDTR